MLKKVNILDCTLRDGGYYNNWDFSINLINKYLDNMSKSNIQFIEIGFRSKILDKNIGLTGYSDDNFINKLKISINIKLGVMINSGELISKESKNKNLIKSFFKKESKNKIKFVRLATHIDDIYKIKNSISWLKKNNYMVAVNIMQVSEINLKNIKKYCYFFKKLKVDIIYLADSLGCLEPKDIKKIYKTFKVFWNSDLGIHAHNNLNLALKNSITALNHGANWIDSTIQGMGRGPGNVKTEELIRQLNKNNSLINKTKNLNQSIINKFKILKKSYKWGTNKYYYYSALNKIHPTYTQELLSSKKKNIFPLLKELSKLDVKKYNPLNLYFINNFQDKNKFAEFNPKRFLKDSKILIIGPGKSVFKEKNKIKKLIKKEKLNIFYTNTVENTLNAKNYFRIACHPYRLITDYLFHIKNNDKLILPIRNLPKKIFLEFKNSKKKVFNFGLDISKTNKINITKKKCVLPNPLIIAYSISLGLAADVKKIYLAGFDGYKKDDPYNDPTQKIINIFKKKHGFNFLYSLTKTNYNINQS